MSFDDLIAALRRGERIRFRLPDGVPSAIRGRWRDLLALPTDGDVFCMYVGPRGTSHWDSRGITQWANERELRDLTLPELPNPRIVAPQSHVKALANFT